MSNASVSSGDKPRTVFLIDDHPVIATGLRLAFSISNEFRLAGLAASAATALQAIDESQPDIVIIDLILDGSVNLALVRDVRDAAPEAILVIFSSLPAELYAAEGHAAGANAFLSKKNDLANLIDCLRRQRAPGQVLRPNTEASAHAPGGPGAAEERASRSFPPVVDGIVLTERERAICEMLGRGLHLESIAAHLRLSKKTIAAHRDNIRRKFSCRTSQELMFRLANAQRIQTTR